MRMLKSLEVDGNDNEIYDFVYELTALFWSRKLKKRLIGNDGLKWRAVSYPYFS